MSEGKTCGDCARFKVPDAGCPNYEYFREYVDGRPLMDAHGAACSDFHQARKVKDKSTKKQMKDSGVTVDGCYEAIYHNGKPYFLVKNSETFSIVESLEVDGQVFYPKEQRNVPYESYGYFEGPVPNREELFWKVREEFESFVDVESIWKDVFSAFTLLSYQQQKLLTAPYIYLYGDNESGKTTVLHVLNALCYRPLFGVTIPAADIYGYLEDSNSVGTVLEDEIQGIHKDFDKIKIYKAGYKKGAKVPRTLMTQNDRIIKYYGVFCLKACASEQLPTVKGFRERFVEVPMVEGYPPKEWADVAKEDLERLRNLRNMLLKWRMQSKEWELPDVELNVKGRLKELWKPVLQVTSGLTVYDGLFKFVDEQRKERLSVKQDTLEGKVVKVVVELCKHAKEPAPFISNLSIWHRLQEELDGKIDDKKPNMMDTSEFFQVTKAKVGYRLREILSGKSRIEKEKGPEGNWLSVRGFIFDTDKLRRIAKKYGYEFSTRLQSLQSSGGRQTLESMEKDHEDNVEKDAPAPPQLTKPRNLVENPKGPSTDGSIPVKSDSTSDISKNSKNENTVGEKNSNSVENLLSRTASLTRLTFNFQDKCVVCGFQGRMDWQATEHDGSWGLLCGNCGDQLAKKLGDST